MLLSYLFLENLTKHGQIFIITRRIEPEDANLSSFDECQTCMNYLSAMCRCVAKNFRIL